VTYQRLRSSASTSVLCLLLSTPAWAQPTDPPPDGAPPTDPAQPPPPPADPNASEVATATISGTVEALDLEAPLSGADIVVVGTPVSTTSDAEGHYTLTLPPGSYKVRIEFGGFQTEERDVTVTAGLSLTLDFALQAVQQLNEVIVVVGSRTPRTNVETPVAIDVVTEDEITHTGRTETGRILNTLAPSYISMPQTVVDGSDHVDPASLRGLGPDQVLVLINGKRRHRSALVHVNGTFGRGTTGTDLGAIPASSIKRIEILRDGAASQYGSDAIAGVINIVTKDITDVVEITTESGITGEGDGFQFKTSANYGFKIGERGFLNLTGEYLQRERTDRSGQYTGAIFTADGAMDEQLLAENGLTRDDFKMRIGEAAAQVAIGSFNLELPVGETATFYSFGDISQRAGDAAGFYRFPRQTKQNVPEFYPFGFLPEIHTNIRDLAVTAGVRRKGNWDVDASITHGQNSFQFNVENSVNASLGTASPTTFDAGTLSASQTVANFDVLHKFDQDTIKALAFVLGSEFRIENYQIKRGDEASFEFGGRVDPVTNEATVPGSQVFAGFAPENEVDRNRTSIGVYAGFESELSKDITFDVGGRFEQASDFGRSLIGKVAARYSLIKQAALRGAVSTGFRAPSLQQLWFSNIATVFTIDAMTNEITAAQSLTSTNESPITKAFGIPELKEEKSINASGGIALRPFDNLSITTDAYFIRLEDRIVLTSFFDAANPIVAEILEPFEGVSKAEFFSNAVDTDTKGLDVVADYAIDLEGAGGLNLTGSANFTKTVVKNVNLPRALADRFADNPDQLNTFFFGRLAKNRLEDTVPHIKGTAAARYTYKGSTALFRANYYGKVAFKPDNPDNDERFGAKVLFDLDLGYQMTKNLRLTIGADNLLNTFPDKQKKAVNINSGRFIYSNGVTQIGQNGGFYYGKLQLTFF
jgi:iron complex outermembrane recepter protein